jgi:hypothetical protein
MSGWNDIHLEIVSTMVREPVAGKRHVQRQTLKGWCSGYGGKALDDAIDDLVAIGLVREKGRGTVHSKRSKMASDFSNSSTRTTSTRGSTGGAGRVPRGLTPRVKAVSPIKRVLCARYTAQSCRSKHRLPSPHSTTPPKTHHPTGTPPRTVRAVPTSSAP